MSNRILLGDCIDVLKRLPNESIDLVVTDPPYLVDYRPRDGRTIQNDRSSDWLKPAFTEIYRVLKNNRFCICFYGWSRVEEFMTVWKRAGFYPVGHLVFTKRYPSSVRFVGCQHETAYLLAKGYPTIPACTLPDILPWRYTGNRLHPTQKPIESIQPLIETFSRPGEIILDPFCGSGTTALAAKQCGRRYIGIEKDEQCHQIAETRLA